MKSGFTQVPNILIRTQHLSSNAKAVLMVIMSFNPSYPSYSVLMESTGLSRPTVAKSLSELVAANVIDYAKGSNLTHKSNIYKVRPQGEWNLQASSKIEPDLVKKFNQPSKEFELPLVKNINSNNTKSILHTIAVEFKNLTSSDKTAAAVPNLEVAKEQQPAANPEKTNKYPARKANQEQAELLSKSLAVPKERLSAFEIKFLEGKQLSLDKYGSFKAAQLQVLKKIAAKGEAAKPELTKKLIIDKAPQIQSAQQLIDWLATFKLGANGEAVFELLILFNQNRLPGTEITAIAEALKVEMNEKRRDEIAYRSSRYEHSKLNAV